MDSIWSCDDIFELEDLLSLAEEETGFAHGRIQVFQDADGTYGIEIDNENYSTYISIEEAESTLRDLFNGIKLVSK